jgi:hypothetical protein
MRSATAFKGSSSSSIATTEEARAHVLSNFNELLTTLFVAGFSGN